MTNIIKTLAHKYGVQVGYNLSAKIITFYDDFDISSAYDMVDELHDITGIKWAWSFVTLGEVG